MKPILHFSHANGFPGGSYQTIFSELSHQYDVRFTDLIGHHPEFPVSNNWHNQEREMAQFFEAHYSEPVIAVGHSLGGVLSLSLAAKRPDLVRAAIALDVPVLSRLEAQGLRLLKRFKLMDRITPAARMDTRRALWPSHEDAIDYFRGKRLMSYFDPQCLQDYVQAGTEPVKEGIRLRFDPKVEQAIYRTIPDDLVFKNPFTVPVAAIGGRESKVFSKTHAVRMQKKLKVAVDWLPGTHMFPFEHPKLTAQAIIQRLQSMGIQ